MPYTLHLDEANGLLDLRYRGVVSAAQRLEAWAESCPLLEASGIRRILIDLREAIAAHEPLQNMQRLANQLTREPILLQSRTAFVAPPAHPANHLFELLAGAHHYPFARFPDRAEAIAWLLSDEPPL
ncbi:MAG: hypothetical protein ACTHKZ_09020 [Lysobacteraceae bacterium]